MNTEEMLQFLNEIAKSKLFSNPAMISKFRKEIKKFKLSKELMNRLKEEEEAIYQTSEKRIVILPDTKSEFKHYMKVDNKYIGINFIN